MLNEFSPFGLEMICNIFFIKINFCTATNLNTLTFKKILLSQRIPVSFGILLIFAGMEVAEETKSETDHPCGENACTAGVAGIRDALYVLNGKWKLPLIFTLTEGPKRFKDIQRSLGDITPKVLSKEL